MRRSVPDQRQAVRPRPDDRPAPGCHDDRHACPCRRNPCIPLLPAGCQRASGSVRDPAGHRDPRRRAGTHRGPLSREHQPRRKGVDRGSHRCLRACRNVRPLPIIALRSPKKGPAIWVLAGIHGEEPAGPNAVAAAIADIAMLGEHRPVVLLPLLNPHGYARNWRYLNVAVYSEDGRRAERRRLLASPAVGRRSVAVALARRLEPRGRGHHGLDSRSTGGLSRNHQPRPARGQPDRRRLRLLTRRARRGRGACDHGCRRAAR